jgi:hypothetical protein
MSPALINRSPDLKRMRDEGYVVEVKQGFLLLHDIPYLNAQRKVLRGTLVAPLTLSGGIAARPNTHVINFIGENPCNTDGSVISAIQHGQNNIQLSPTIVANRSFSNKPTGGYTDNYHKFTTYAGILSHPAMELDPDSTPQTYRLIESQEEDSVFQYTDTNSSRNGTLALSAKFVGQKIGIIGLGGTGAYILDFVAKTPVAEIHLYDDDRFSAHNAFRTPGAATLEDVNSDTPKVEFLARTYGAMHKGLVPHNTRIIGTTLQLLDHLDFVFIAIDSGEHKQRIFDHLQYLDIPFVDVGIGVFWTDDKQQLQSAVRTTFGSKEHHAHLKDVVSFAPDDEDLYASNIQVAELNCLNATMAVIKWKQHLEFYLKVNYANHTVLTINDTSTINEF